MLALIRPPTTRLRWWLAASAVAVLGVVAAVVVAPRAADAAEVDTNAWYVLVARHSGKALDVYGGSTADGANVVQWTRHDGDNQQFQFVDSGSGYYRVKARHSGKVLDVSGISTADGAGIQQYTDWNGTNQQFRLVDTDSGYVKLVARHSGKVIDVKDLSTADGATVQQWTDWSGSNQQWRLVKVGGGGGGDPGLVGWATQNGGTSGGAGGSTTTVTSASALSSAISGTTARTVRVSGTISCSGMLRVGSNKSVIGNSGAAIVGCGFTVDESRNVIIRNLTFRDWGDDAVNVEESSNVWVDHNTLSNGNDGAVDVKRGSDYVTVSWNRFFNHQKTMLLGHSDSNGGQDRGKLRVTYHHNWFDGTAERHPRVRFGNPVHVFNNYYDGVGVYGVASTGEAGVLVEGNYFENTGTPCVRGYGDSPDPGGLVQRNNHFVSSGSCASGGSVRSIPYSYQLDTASNVKSIVMSGAGAGKISA